MKPVPTPRPTTLARIERGLRMVTVPMPHLAGLAAAVRVDIDDRVPTMGVFASGRMVANRQFAAQAQGERTRLRAGARTACISRFARMTAARGSGRLEFNYAHDYIINDILRAELGFTHVPAGGLDMPGAQGKIRRADRARDAQRWRQHAVEDAGLGRQFCFGAERAQPLRPAARTERRRRRARRRSASAKCFRNATAIRPVACQERCSDAAAKSRALAKAMGAMKGRGIGERRSHADCVRAARAFTGRPGRWRCRNGSSPSRRANAPIMRPSRREAGRSDIVLARPQARILDAQRRSSIPPAR